MSQITWSGSISPITTAVVLVTCTTSCLNPLVIDDGARIVPSGGGARTDTIVSDCLTEEVRGLLMPLLSTAFRRQYPARTICTKKTQKKLQQYRLA